MKPFPNVGQPADFLADDVVKSVKIGGCYHNGAADERRKEQRVNAEIIDGGGGGGIRGR